MIRTHKNEKEPPSTPKPNFNPPAMSLIDKKSCDGCEYLDLQRETMKYTCMPYPCRECSRQASDKYSEKD